MPKNVDTDKDQTPPPLERPFFQSRPKSSRSVRRLSLMKVYDKLDCLFPPVEDSGTNMVVSCLNGPGRQKKWCISVFFSKFSSSACWKRATCLLCILSMIDVRTISLDCSENSALCVRERVVSRDKVRLWVEFCVQLEYILLILYQGPRLDCSKLLQILKQG